jgi:hypothetical protein
VFPVGKEDRGLGSGVTVFEPFVAFSQMLPRDAFMHVHAGFELPSNTDIAPKESYWRTALGKTFTRQSGTGRAWSPMVELLGVHEFVTGSEIEWDIVPQMQVTLSRRGHIMASAGMQFPLSERDRPKRFMFYLLWDWFDGGLLSGW